MCNTHGRGQDWHFIHCSAKAGCQECIKDMTEVIRDGRKQNKYPRIHLLRQKDRRKNYLPESVLDYEPILNSTQGMDWEREKLKCQGIINEPASQNPHTGEWKHSKGFQRKKYFVQGDQYDNHVITEIYWPLMFHS